jgi:ribonuclease D
LFAVGLTSRQVQRFGRELLDAIRQGREAPLVQMPARVRPDPAFLNRLNALGNWRKKTARTMGVESDVVLPRRFLEGLAERPPRSLDELAVVMQVSPWRFEHFGAEILAVLTR